MVKELAMSIKDEELKKKFGSIQDLVSSGENPGMALCALALTEIFLTSKTERRNHSIRYLQDGRLRAVADIQEGVPHGEIIVFYPDGKIWMKGAYKKGKMVSESFVVFMPDGSVAKPNNNVIPFPKKT